ncbi:MAG: SDR family oxidoreductase [Myxococcales bacterium]
MIRLVNVLVAGCGWLGTAVARALVAQGHRVTGIRRDPQRAQELSLLGITPLPLDLTQPSAGDRLPGELDWIVACQAASGEDVEAYRSAYLQVNETLLQAARRRRVRGFVYTSSTGVFGQSDGQEVDETTPVEPASDTAKVLAEAERLVLAGPVPGRVVRLSGLYGPGRYGVIDRVRSGRLALGPGDEAWTNWCHQEDAAAFVLAALERGRPGGLYHASDAQPLRRRELVEWIAGQLGIEPKRSGEAADRGPLAAGRAHRRISSERTRAELGLALRYPSVREGLAAPLSSPS